MLTIYIYNCTFLHKNDDDRNKMSVIRATAIKSCIKIDVVHQFVVILIVLKIMIP